MKKHVLPVWLAGFIGAMAVFAAAFTAEAVLIDISPQGRLGRPRQPHYNIKVGELQLAFTGNFWMRWTDNIGYEDNGGSGWSAVPSLGLDVYYPVTRYFQIKADVTVGYEYYISGDGKDQFFLRGSEGALQAGVTGVIRLGEGSFIQLRSQVSREIDSLDIAVRNRDEQYSAWTHTFSALYSKNINVSTTGRLQYIHQDRWATDKEYNYLDYHSDSLDAVVLYQLLNKLRLGPYVRITSMRFPEGRRNDRVIYEGGLSGVGEMYFVRGVNYNFRIGYEIPDIDTGNDPDATDEESGFSGEFNISVQPQVFPGHRVSLSYDRNYKDTERGVNYVDEFLVGYGIDIRIRENFIVNADINWVDISESDGGENAQLWRFYLGCRHRLTEKATLRAGYRYTTKSSNVSNRDYTQNLIELGISYRF